MRVESVCRLWCAYRQGMLRRQDVQTWFAAHELLSRRCTLKEGRTVRYSVDELVPMTGFRPSAIAASIRRLEAAELLFWSERRIAFDCPTDAERGEVSGLSEMLAAVKNRRRVLPVPRQTVLLLARTRRPVMLATILGHLFRCMYYRSEACASWGTCKASWIAEVFGVDVRNVKAARVELQACGWLCQLESLHWHRQRYGGTFIIRLGWRNCLPAQRPASPPRRVAARVKSPPPDSHRDLPSGFNNQKRRDAASGVHGPDVDPAPAAPTLRNVVPADLANPERTAELFRQAVRARLLKDSPMTRLQFFAASERARRLGRNPGGFLLSVMKRNLWRNISHDDEDAARRTLAQRPDLLYVQSRSDDRSAIKPEPCMTCPDDEVLDQASIRELVGKSLSSVTGVPTSGSQLLTHSIPSHLVAEELPAQRNGVKEGHPRTRGAKALTPFRGA